MRTAYVFEDVGGWFSCAAGGPLDTRGRAHATKRGAIAGLRSCDSRKDADYRGEYTHYTFGGRDDNARPIPLYR